MNYYNENDTRSAQWLKNLITAGLIPKGHVDDRSITEVQSGELQGYTQCHFFAGIGGWSYALQLAGIPATTRLWTGSCPCQPFSAAGKKLGEKDKRHLWPIFFNLIRECKPECIFGEQVAGAIKHGWLDRIQADLESQDYTCGATVLGAHSVGAPHLRQRLYWVAHTNSGRCTQCDEEIRSIPITDKNSKASHWDKHDFIPCQDGKHRRIESGTFPLAYGVPSRMVRLGAYGNAIVPQVAAEFVKAFYFTQKEQENKLILSSLF